MADGELILKLDDDTARRLKAAADAAGRPVADYVSDLISHDLDTGRWIEAQQALEDYDRTGESADAATVMAGFRERVSRRAAGD
ncbi:MAG: hypothetical protein V4597_05020 [Pseudomonadota bacterium]